MGIFKVNKDEEYFYKMLKDLNTMELMALIGAINKYMKEMAEVTKKSTSMFKMEKYIQ